LDHSIAWAGSAVNTANAVIIIILIRILNTFAA
jgi:hypothetical protein